MLKLVGVLLPFFIDIVNSKIPSSQARFFVSILVCSFFGVGVSYIETNGFSTFAGMTMLEVANALSESVLVMVGVAQITYKAVWEKLDIRNSLGLNAKTNGTEM